MADKTEKKPVEITAYSVDLYPDMNTKKVVSSKYLVLSDTDEKTVKARIDLLLPVPENDEESMELYGKTIDQLIEMGVNRNSHDERDMKPFFDKYLEDNDTITEEFLAEVVDIAKAAHKIPKRETKTSQAKESMKAIETLRVKLGMPLTATPEEVMAESLKRLAE